MFLSWLVSVAGHLRKGWDHALELQNYSTSYYGNHAHQWLEYMVVNWRWETVIFCGTLVLYSWSRPVLWHLRRMRGIAGICQCRLAALVDIESYGPLCRSFVYILPEVRLGCWHETSTHEFVQAIVAVGPGNLFFVVHTDWKSCTIVKRIWYKWAYCTKRLTGVLMVDQQTSVLYVLAKCYKKRPQSRWRLALRWRMCAMFFPL